MNPVRCHGKAANIIFRLLFISVSANPVGREYHAYENRLWGKPNERSFTPTQC